MECAFRFVEMISYVMLSAMVHEGAHVGSIIWPIVMSTNIHSFCIVISHFTSVIRKWAGHGKDSTMSDMWSPVSHWSLSSSLPLLVQAVMSSILMVDLSVTTESDHDKRSHLDDILMAACLLLSCFRFIWAWRLSVIGSRIFTICQTFMAGAVNQILFILFMLLFAFIAALMVLSRLHTVRLAVDSYRSFLFGDGDGFNGLGMQIDHNALLESNVPLLAFAVLGSFFFNVIVLNIIIAIYGHEYDRVERETPLLFMMGRADYCVQAILSYYHITWRGEGFHRCLIASAFVLFAIGFYVGKLMESPWGSAMFFAAGQVLLPMAVMQCSWFSPEGQDADDHERFLWICHPRDWQWTSDEFDFEEGLHDVTEHLSEEVTKVDHKVVALEEKLDKVTYLLQSLCDRDA